MVDVRSPDQVLLSMSHLLDTIIASYNKAHVQIEQGLLTGKSQWIQASIKILMDELAEKERLLSIEAAIQSLQVSAGRIQPQEATSILSSRLETCQLEKQLQAVIQDFLSQMRVAELHLTKMPLEIQIAQRDHEHIQEKMLNCIQEENNFVDPSEYEQILEHKINSIKTKFGQQANTFDHMKKRNEKYNNKLLQHLKQVFDRHIAYMKDEPRFKRVKFEEPLMSKPVTQSMETPSLLNPAPLIIAADDVNNQKGDLFPESAFSKMVYSQLKSVKDSDKVGIISWPSLIDFRRRKVDQLKTLKVKGIFWNSSDRIYGLRIILTDGTKSPWFGASSSIQGSVVKSALFPEEATLKKIKVVTVKEQVMQVSIEKKGQTLPFIDIRADLSKVGDAVEGIAQGFVLGSSEFLVGIQVQVRNGVLVGLGFMKWDPALLSL